MFPRGMLGEVEEVGEAVHEVSRGDRVITMMQGLGGVHARRPGATPNTSPSRPPLLRLLRPESIPMRWRRLAYQGEAYEVSAGLGNLRADGLS